MGDSLPAVASLMRSSSSASLAAGSAAVELPDVSPSQSSLRQTQLAISDASDASAGSDSVAPSPNARKRGLVGAMFCSTLEATQRNSASSSGSSPGGRSNRQSSRKKQAEDAASAPVMIEHRIHMHHDMQDKVCGVNAVAAAEAAHGGCDACFMLGWFFKANLLT